MTETDLDIKVFREVMQLAQAENKVLRQLGLDLAMKYEPDNAEMHAFLAPREHGE